MDIEELTLTLLETSSFSSSESTDDDEENLMLLDQPLQEMYVDKSRFDKNRKTDELFFKKFRFYKEDVDELLRLPDFIHLQNRSIFSKEECLLCILERLSYPCRFINIAQEFGRQVSEVSLAINEGKSIYYHM